MDTVIPAGYQLTVNSWEKDGDVSRTLTKAGLTLEEAKFYVGFIKFFGDKGYDVDFGNMFEPNETELNEAHTTIGKYFKAHPKESLTYLNLKLDETNDLDILNDVIYYLHGQFFGYSEYYHFRVLDSFKVEYLAEPVTLKNVTKDFK